MKVFEPSFPDESVELALGAIYGGQLGFGSNVLEFEKAYAAYSGCSYNVGVSSASAGAWIVFAWLREYYGMCVVYTPSLGFISPAWAAEQLGHIVVLVDVDEDGLMSENSYLRARAKVEGDYPGLKQVVMPVLYGGVSRLPYNPRVHGDEVVVLDSAHCVKPTMDFDYALFSFHCFKPIHMANGGLIACNREEDSKWFESYRNFGRIPKGDSYTVSEFGGFNFYLNNLNASLGLPQLSQDRVDRAIGRRRCVYDAYADNLDASKGRLMRHDDGSSFYFATYVSNEPNAVELRAKLKKVGCETAFHYPPIHVHDYQKFTFHELPRTERLAERIVNLPLHHAVSDAEAINIIDLLNKA